MPPAAAAAPVTVKATVSWLACRDRCELGGAELELRLPLAPAEAAAGRALLNRWRGRLPVDARREPPPFSLRTAGGFGGDAPRGTLSLWLGWPDEPGSVEVFPAPAEGLGVSAAGARTRGRLTRVDCELSLLDGADPPRSFPAVVVRTAADGARLAWRVEVPLPR